MGKLTTHILDTSTGKPGGNIRIDLFRLTDSDKKLITHNTTNPDGRTDAPLLEGAAFNTGTFELVFHVGPYFDRTGLSLPDPKFLDEVVIRFGIADKDQHYHVPLLISPYGYSTYRGS
jgi:5-hydroxyisourate hydrolase|tara:strand:+ start:75 stop:428 length:354 start_codon:yes stop_codon:yes gene_type:complete